MDLKMFMYLRKIGNGYEEVRTRRRYGLESLVIVSKTHKGQNLLRVPFYAAPSLLCVEFVRSIGGVAFDQNSTTINAIARVTNPVDTGSYMITLRGR